MHYYKFNIGDYHSHTSYLSPMEDLAYRRMIDHYYLTEHTFKVPSSDVARTIGLPSCIAEVEYILKTFFEKKGDEWVHERIEKELEDYKKKVKACSDGGKKSRVSRPGKVPSSDLKGKSKVCRRYVEVTTNQEPLTINQKKEPPYSPPTKKSDRKDTSAVNGHDKRFDIFWEQYPNKKAKQNAIKAWNKIKPDDDLFNEIMSGLERFNNNPRWKDAEQWKFIPHPATWLNAGRWSDRFDLETGYEKLDPFNDPYGELL